MVLSALNITCKTVKVDPSLTTYTKLITHVLKTYCKHTIELWEEYVDVNLCDPSLGNDFLYKTPKAQVIKEKNRNSFELNFSQNRKPLLCFKETIMKMKR